VTILTAHDANVSIRKLFDTAQSAFEAPEAARGRAIDTCLELVRQRLRTVLIDQGIAYDTVDAVLAVAGDDVPDAAARAGALHAVRGQPVMARLATGFARASRILSQGSPADSIDVGLFREPAERALHAGWSRVRDRVAAEAGARRYRAALEALVDLADPIDQFFDKVMVIDPDERVRANRLAMLKAVSETFLTLANFAMLTGERPVRSNHES
jgi:glycyl-tRNA synthetase beta chain